MKTDFFKFVKKFTTFKPPPYHEAFFKAIEKADIEHSRRWYKDLHLNELLYSNLIKLEKGQTFAVASLKGIHIFKKTKFQDYQEKSNITLAHTTKGETNGQDKKD